MKRIIKKNKRSFKKRKKGFLPKLFFSVGIFSSIIVLSAGAFLLFSPRFQIKELSVVGNNDISTDDIKKIATEQMQKSFSLLGKEIKTESIFLSVAGEINILKQTFPQIESIAIKKNFPNGLFLEITEKTPYANWCEQYEGSKCYLVDKKGSFIKDIQENKEGLMLVNEKEKYENMEKKEILACLDKISGGLAENSISTVSFNIFKDRVVVRSNLSCDIIFKLKGDIDSDWKIENLDWQIEKLGYLLKDGNYTKDLNKLEYIDLRDGNKVNIK
ncbi:MAG: FtsQ-type POTRA domain-containing protein [Candidatus Pacebacteria bacterium]|nr:FtsQ-type POTRA domain-containing protein [Candidatus Paceibacterota bacterium]